MTKVTFRTGARAIKFDMDRIGDLAEGDVTRLVRALIADNGGDAIFNTILEANISLVDLGATIQVSTTTETFFAANSFFGNCPAQTVGTYTDTGGAAPSARLHAVVERYIERDSRVYADTSVPPILQTDATAGIAILEEYRLEVIDDLVSVPAYTKPVGDQVSIDSIVIATLNGDGSGITFDPDGIIWAFPGLPSATVAHAVSHTTGGDQIPAATAGSRGLLEAQEFTTIRDSIQTIVAAGGSPIGVATVGDNNPTDKTATLSLTTGTGLTQAGGTLAVDPAVVAMTGHGHAATKQVTLTKVSSDNVSGVYTFLFSGLSGVATVVVNVYFRRNGVLLRLADHHDQTVGGSTVEVGVEVWWDSAAGVVKVNCPSGVLARVTGTAAAALGLAASAQNIFAGGTTGDVVVVVSHTGTV